MNSNLLPTPPSKSSPARLAAAAEILSGLHNTQHTTCYHHTCKSTLKALPPYTPLSSKPKAHGTLDEQYAGSLLPLNTHSSERTLSLAGRASSLILDS